MRSRFRGLFRPGWTTPSTSWLLRRLHPHGGAHHLVLMEYRLLGRSGLKVPVLCFGAATFGGGTEFFRAWGASDVEEAKRLVGLCLDAGVNFFDTADVYSNGLSEQILGKAIEGKRHDLLISTKATFPM